MSKEIFILSQDNWFIAEWQGDPGRTLVPENAKIYNTLKGAKIAKTYYEKRYGHVRKMNLKIIDLPF